MNISQYHRTSSVWRDGRPWWVYLHLAADGAVLYVGCSSDPKKRSTAHRLNSVWWPQVVEVRMFGPYGYEPAHDVERLLIEELDPPHNFVFTSRWRERIERNRMYPKKNAA